MIFSAKKKNLGDNSCNSGKAILYSLIIKYLLFTHTYLGTHRQCHISHISERRKDNEMVLQGLVLFNHSSKYT